MTFATYFMAWNVAAVICLVVGILLMVYEMFTPGMGVAALLGALSLIAAVVLSASSFAHAMITLALIMILLGICAFFVFRAFAAGKLKRIVLSESMSGDATPLADLQAMVGQEGVCITPLRPAGIAEFGDKRLDVVSEGVFAAKDERVRIEKIEGLRIVVRKVEE